MNRLVATRAIWLFAGLIVRVTSASDAPKLRVPEGFVVERVAGEPDVMFPMFATFDDRGRLFVAESSGLDLYAEVSALTRKCRVSVLEDRDGDGRFETSRVFADKLVFPMGLAWRDGKLYVADPPDLVTLEDSDDDGQADERTVILTGFGHRDNGSLHGLVFGPDGWLYMTCGHPDGYKLKRSVGPELSGQSGALLRCRPDGSDVEVICRGFENLVEIAFLPAGEIIGTDNWFQLPTAGVRDALVHLVEGGLYPRHEQDVGTAQPITGEPLPAVSLFPAVALSGLVRYRGGGFAAEMRHNLFSAQHNARKVGRHVLVRDGSTFRSSDFDFVTTDDPDFHPSDVLEDADGSLLVVDTGGWYVQHCPTGKIRNSRAPGGIYRVRYGAAHAIDDPWGRQIGWKDSSVEELVGLLADPRTAVRDRAQRALAGHGVAAVPALASLLKNSASATARAHAIWSLAAIADRSSVVPLCDALQTNDTEFVTLAARAVGRHEPVVRPGAEPKQDLSFDERLKLDREFREVQRRLQQELSRLLKHEAPQVQFASVEAMTGLGLVFDPWRKLAANPDRFLEHALIHAQVRWSRGRGNFESLLRDPNPRVQKGALLLVAQSPHTEFTCDRVLACLAAPDAEVRKTAVWVLQRHPEWGKQAVGLLEAWMKSPTLLPDELHGLRSLILAFQSQSSVQALVAGAIADPGGKLSFDRRVLLLETIAQSSVAELPESWVEAIAQTLRHGDPSVRAQAVRTAAVLQVRQLDDLLAGVAGDAHTDVALRVEALRAVVGRRPDLAPGAFDLLIEQLSDQAAPLERLAAAEALGRSRLDDAQLQRLMDMIGADALVWPTLFPAFARSKRLETGSRLVERLGESVRSGGWRPSEMELRNVLEGYPEQVRVKAEPLLELLRRDVERQRERLAEFETLLDGGDAERGRRVFFGKQVACSACHRVGSEGGRVGPDLTKIGAVRAGRDLVESLVLPSSTFAQGYENYLVATTDGRVAGGILARESAETIVLRDSSGAELRLGKKEIQEMKRQTASIMPEGLEAKLTREEFRDLLAFLQSLK